MSAYPKDLRPVIIDGMMTQGMVILIGGPFLAAFLVLLGANYFWIGLAAAIPALAQLMQLPGVFLLEKYPHRRRICVVFSFASRIIWLLPIISVFFATPLWVLFFTIIAVTVQSALGAVSATSWNSWMRDLIPQNILGRFFSHRMRLATMLGLVLSVGLGFLLDKNDFLNI